MKKEKLFTFIFRVCIAMLFVSVASCSDSETEKTENSDSSTIEGIWEYVGQDEGNDMDFINLKPVNGFEVYEIGHSSYSKYPGNYYYDQNTGLMLLYWGRYDCDVYEVIKLTNKELVFCWIDDVADRYPSNQFSVSAAWEVIREVYKEGYSLEFEDYEYYTRSSESKLNSALSGLNK